MLTAVQAGLRADRTWMPTRPKFALRKSVVGAVKLVVLKRLNASARNVNRDCSLMNRMREILLHHQIHLIQRIAVDGVASDVSERRCGGRNHYIRPIEVVLECPLTVRREDACRRIYDTRPKRDIAEEVRLSIRQTTVVIGVPKVQRLAALQADDARCLPSACDCIDDAGNIRAVFLPATEWHGPHDARRVVESLIETRRSLVVVRIVEILRIGRAAVASFKHLTHIVDRLRICERVQQRQVAAAMFELRTAASCSRRSPSEPRP